MTAIAMTKQVTSARSTRRGYILGILYVLVGLAILVLFARGTGGDLQTTFGMNPGRRTQAIRIPDAVVPSRNTLYLLSALSLFMGIWQLSRSQRPATWMLGPISLFFVLAFLTWAARGGSLNMVGMLESTLLRATPIALAALSGVMCERSGVVNIAIEGMMLSAACTATIVGSLTHNLWFALFSALIAGGLLGGLLAIFAIRFKVDQIISGTAINILSTGATSFISARFLAVYQDLNNPGKFTGVPIPLLSKIPVVGPIFFENNVLLYMLLLLLAIMHVMLFYTRWGLRTRAVGEHPRAADTLGINVFKIRYVNVILGGMVAGLSGAWLILGSVGRFDELMSAGKGFIGLAAMIFGKWTPLGAFTSSLLFGFADSLQAKLQILKVPIPSEFLLMAPYLVTMVVLAGVVGRAAAPAADGQPYEKQ